MKHSQIESMTLVAYKNGVLISLCTKSQRSNIEFHRAKGFIPYPKLMSHINEKYCLSITDIGQLTQKQAREIIQDLRKGHVKR